MFNKDIREWRLQTNNLKTWSNYKTFFHRAHNEQRRAVTTTGKGGYTAAVQKLYDVPPPPPEENHGEIDNLNTIVQGIQTQSYEMVGLAQPNAALTSYNSAVMAQLAHMTVTMNAMQAQLNIL